eukprot:Gb_03007 [translate_table: standard]
MYKIFSQSLIRLPAHCDHQPFLLRSQKNHVVHPSWPCSIPLKMNQRSLQQSVLHPEI